MANKKVNPLMNVIRSEFPKKLQLLYSVSPEDASDKQVFLFHPLLWNESSSVPF